MQQHIASVREELSKKEQALRSITGKVSHTVCNKKFVGPLNLEAQATL